MRKRPIISTVTFMVILLLPLLATSLTFAQVQTRVRVVHASNAGNIIDPLLGDLQNQLGSVFSFSSYQLLGDVNIILVGHKPAEVFVHRGGSIELTLMEQRRNIAEIRIIMRMKGTPILNTQVRLSSGKTVLIGGPLYEEGVAIVALIANF
jgi:hypothetical protein